jgi:hypothetical protein
MKGLPPSEKQPTPKGSKIQRSSDCLAPDYGRFRNDLLARPGTFTRVAPWPISDSGRRLTHVLPLTPNFMNCLNLLWTWWRSKIVSCINSIRIPGPRGDSPPDGRNHLSNHHARFPLAEFTAAVWAAQAIGPGSGWRRSQILEPVGRRRSPQHGPRGTGQHVLRACPILRRSQAFEVARSHAFACSCAASASSFSRLSAPPPRM